MIIATSKMCPLLRSKPEPEAAKTKGGRKPAKKANAAKKPVPAKKATRKAEAGPLQQKGPGNLNDAAR
jgi:hypothetical protein